jgi:signal transduction histidine kinase/CheY-like chemotaxis protein
MDYPPKENQEGRETYRYHRGGGLRLRIFFPLLVIGVALGLIFTVFFWWFFRDLLDKNLRSDTDLIINAVEFNTNKAKTIEEVVGFLTFLGQGSMLESVLIYDATNNRVFAESRSNAKDTQSLLEARKVLLDYLRIESAKQSPTTLYLPRNEGVFWVFRSINLQDTTVNSYFDAIIHLQIDAMPFLSSINQSLVLITLSWKSFIVAILIATAIFLWRTILAPSRTIIKVISQVEKGKYDVTVPEISAGEIGTIARALNSLFQTIQQQELELKEKNQNLQLATKDAQEKGEAKTRFLANMSHEIRTPLNAVLGFSHLLTNTTLSNKQAELVDSIKSSGESLLALINDILDFSKVESEAIEFDHVRFNLLELVDSTLDVIASRVTEVEIGFGYTIQKGMPTTFTGDPDRLRQVLLNLLTNAIKFTERGFIQLSLGGEDINSEVFSLEVEIKDTGIGIAKENMERLFTPFTQEDASTTRRYGGTGLGLSISKRIIEANGGDIVVESTPGFGSSFNFSYPLGRIDTDSRAIKQQTLASKKLALISRRSTLIDSIKSFMVYLSVDLEVFYSVKDYILQSQLKGLDCDWTLYDFEAKKHHHYEDVLKLHEHFRHESHPLLVYIPLRWVEDFDWPEDRSIWAYLSPPPRFYALYNILLHDSRDFFESNLGGRGEEEPDGKKTEAQDLKKRILLVEDNAVNQKVSTMLLEDMGCEVMVANNGQEAINVLQEDRDFSLVLMDIQMPVMDGHSATELLRSMGPPFDTIPIVALSANAFKEEKESALSSGMNDFLSKPVNQESLQRVIDQYAKIPPALGLEANAVEKNKKKGATSNKSLPLSSLEEGLEGFRQKLGEDFHHELIQSLQELLQESFKACSVIQGIGSKEAQRDSLSALVHKLKGGLRQVGDQDFSTRFEKLETVLVEDNLDVDGALANAQSWLKEIQGIIQGF